MEDDNKAAEAESGNRYVGVIYFHGMGSQRRYEEVSRLIESVDGYLAAKKAAGESRGFLGDIKPRLEPSRVTAGKNATYIGADYVDGSGAKPVKVRFHEVYWAPIMAGQRSALGVFKWILKRAVRPFGTLRAPWRERQRLRRATLAEMFEREAPEDPVRVEDYDKLARLYDSFEGLQAIRDYPEGHFDQFVDFVEKSRARDPERAGRMVTLAKDWFSRYRQTELRNAFVVGTMALGIAVVAVAAIWAATFVIGLLGRLAAGTSLAGFLPENTLMGALSVALAGASAVGLKSFLTDYMGDVEAWATYEETDEKHELRAKVIARGIDTLTHVLTDPSCKRAVVVAHSLGTTIAHDCLLVLARNNRASHSDESKAPAVPLLKIEHFVTMGSPIDKIEYFFESYTSSFHRYRRVVENLRGDIDTMPFCKNRNHPHVHWINFWDDADIIGGPLHSPAGRHGFTQRVDNVHVASLGFPNPGASHSAYFFDNAVVENLFEVICKRAYSFPTLPPRVGKGRDFASQFVGPAIDAPGKRLIWQGMALTVPWFGALGLLGYWIAPAASYWWAAPAGVPLAVLFAGFLVNKRQPQRRPISPSVGSDDTDASEMATT
ncbi:MAG TPA: hypothetical protein PLG99_01090 [Kaistiaceae bacterium]|nr:hypothetical protein [Kaistiaceae bacterium]